MVFEEYIHNIFKEEGVPYVQLDVKENRKLLERWRAHFDAGHWKGQRGADAPLDEVVDAEERNYGVELRYAAQEVNKYFIVSENWHKGVAFSCDARRLPSLEALRSARARFAVCDAEFQWTYVFNNREEIIFAQRAVQS
jgi:hypothetical protein